MNPILSIQNVSKQYETTLAVNDVSLDIPEKSIFGLLGPNGAGKTTLIRMITTILYQDSGTITLHNIPPNVDRSRYIGYMPEERGLYKKMKVGEHLIYLAQLKGANKVTAKQRTQYWLEKLAIHQWEKRPIEELSKGMQQKIQFIAAVIHEPSLIILDEPFSGLDPINANLIQDEIFELRQKGATIIFSTHRMEQVELICEHIALVNKGKIVLQGTVKDIQQAYKKHHFLVNFAGETTLQQQPDLFEVVAQQDQQATIALLNNAKISDILQYLLSSGVDMTGFREILPSINQIFIERVAQTA